MNCTFTVAVAAEPVDHPDAIALFGESDAHLIQLHLPEAWFGLDVAALRVPRIRFAPARDPEGKAHGCGGVAFLDGYAELKRMLVRPASRGRGIAEAIDWPDESRLRRHRSERPPDSERRTPSRTRAAKRAPMTTLTAPGLVPEPLAAAHADEMFEILSDPEIYRYLGYPPPPSLDYLRGIYAPLEAGKSPDGGEAWLSWIVREPGEPPMGFAQATVLPDARAWVAFVLSSKRWGKGYAFAATQIMLGHLETGHGIVRFPATVENDNARSIGLLERLGSALTVNGNRANTTLRKRSACT